MHVEARVVLLDKDGKPGRSGHFAFVVLPRIGELLSLQKFSDRYLRVAEICHEAFPPDVRDPNPALAPPCVSGVSLAAEDALSV